MTSQTSPVLANASGNKIKCCGTASDGVVTERPMKARIFVRRTARTSVGVLYKGRGPKGKGVCIGAFSIEELLALEVAAKVARAELTRLLGLSAG